jgi:hypothetical protein
MSLSSVKSETALRSRLFSSSCPPPRVVYEDRLYNAGADAIIALVKGTAPTVRTLFEIARRARKPAAYFFSATRCQEGGENNVKASED